MSTYYGSNPVDDEHHRWLALVLTDHKRKLDPSVTPTPVRPWMTPGGERLFLVGGWRRFLVILPFDEAVTFLTHLRCSKRPAWRAGHKGAPVP